jgi:predicted transcriptional regulator
MSARVFKERVRAAMVDQNLSIRDLSNRANVPYHAIHKFLSRENASTNIDHALEIARALGIRVDENDAYDELSAVIARLSDAEKAFLFRSARGLLADQ